MCVCVCVSVCVCAFLPDNTTGLREDVTRAVQHSPVLDRIRGVVAMFA